MSSSLWEPFGASGKKQERATELWPELAPLQEVPPLALHPPALLRH